MNKLPTIVLSIVTLAAFTGLSGAQNKKGPDNPNPNKITLSKTKKVAKAAPNKGCPITVRVWYSGDPSIVYPRL